MIQKTKNSREAWLYERRGSSHSDADSNGWTKLWGVKVLSKVKNFLWRLAQHSIPTTAVLNQRNMSPSRSCCLCGVEDTWRHALLNCTVSRSTWALSSDAIIDRLSSNVDDNAKTWLFTMHESLTHEEFTKFVVTLWALWGARRKAILEQIYQSPFAIRAFVRSYLGELDGIQAPAPISSNSIMRPTQWIAPPPGTVKINVDASVGRGGRYGSVGALCRDQTGFFLGASAIVFQRIFDPATLECMAVREALALADDLYERNIQVSSDCKVVVEDIRDGNPTVYGALIQEIIDHKSTFQSCNFSHEFRISNVEAHKLAKHALSLPPGRHV